jgi:predicted Zn-ribbon and HTH transcriptional regulator
MVLKMDGLNVIGHPLEAKPAKCEDCGVLDELRPYGKNAANVCFDCAMKDEANAAAMFRRRLDGDA